MIGATFKLAGAIASLLIFTGVRAMDKGTGNDCAKLAVISVALVVGCYLGLWFASDIVSGAWMVAQ